MKVYPECLNCGLRQFIKNLSLLNLNNDIEVKELRNFLRFLSDFDYSKTPPEMGRHLYHKIRDLSGRLDLFEKEKDQHNNAFLENYQDFKNFVTSQEDTFHQAAKLSIVANIIDFGPGHSFDLNDFVEFTSKQKLFIDETDLLRSEIEKAKNILYLGDNCGELVFDKLFIETINKLYKNKQVTFVVRSSPIINDVTIKEALNVGIDKVSTVISSGYDAPGTILSESSEEFLDIFNSADVIISKGQGNFEGLSTSRENIFYLLTVKCEIVARYLQAPIKSLVLVSSKKLHKMGLSL